MPLPVIFANLTSPNMAQLDQNFAALGALTPIPCAITGGNSLALTPLTNTPTLAAYNAYQVFVGAAPATNTTAVTATVAGLATKPVYKDTASGPVALTGSEIIANNIVVLVYDAALNGGGGGFHLCHTRYS